MAKSEKSVEELVSMIERGELRLPEMQRRYVWRSTRVRDLMDSLYRGYPSGAILLWETDEAVPLQDFAVEQQTNAYQTKLLLLDGQQRLTSLSAVVRGKQVTVRGRRRPIELLFNLEHPEEPSLVTEVNEEDDEDGDDDLELELDETDSTEDELQKRFDKMAFVVATRKLEQLPHWVKVTDVFQSDSDAPFLKRAGITDFEDPRYQKYSERLARLRGVKKYSYRMDVLERSMGYDEVTEIFVRVNSLGTKLRSSDLALAQITARWRGALKTFQEFQDACSDRGFDVDLGLHLRNLVSMATGQSRFLTVSNVSLERLQASWKDAVKGMEYAINFMRSNAGIESPALLSSPFILVALSNYAHRRNYEVTPDEADRIRYWLLLANAKGRYSRGSSETILDQDLAVLRQGGAGELIERLRQQVGRLDIAPEDLEGRNQRSALFKTMFLAFHAAGAKDWRSNLAIALDHSGNQHRLQFHHIFPKALLKRNGFSPREADDIANLAFIGGKTNRSISDKSPAEYLPALMKTAGEDVFTKQCIPTTPALLAPEAYKQFLSERRKLIRQRLNEYLQVVNDR
jgi:hypothetical protein